MGFPVLFCLVLGVVLSLGAQAWEGESSRSELLQRVIGVRHTEAEGFSGNGRTVSEDYQSSEGNPGSDASSTHVYLKPSGGLDSSWREGACLAIGICSYFQNGKKFYFVNSATERYFKDGVPVADKWESEGSGVYRLKGTGSPIRITFHPGAAQGTLPAQTAEVASQAPAQTAERSPHLISVNSRKELNDYLNGQNGKPGEKRKEIIYVFTAKDELCAACKAFKPKLYAFANKMKDTVGVYEIDASMLYYNRPDPGRNPAGAAAYDELLAWATDKRFGAAEEGKGDQYPYINRWSYNGAVWAPKKDENNQSIRGEAARSWLEQQAGN